MRAIGVAGTAKNTGKTTTALEIIRQSVDAGWRTALTSIGYDGEERDHITALPKPRYWLPQGMMVATAERCLQASSARGIERKTTAIRTALGRIVVVEVREPGLVLVAGPHRATELGEVLEIFHKLGADLAVVDGALNRCVPLIRTQGLVLATGAALDERIVHVASHAEAVAALFALPVAADARAWHPARISVRADGRVTESEMGSLLGDDARSEIHRLLAGSAQDLVIPGACNPRILRRLLDGAMESLRSARVVLGNPLKLLASGDVAAWSSLIADARRRGQRIEYLETLPLICMTVNPFYPRYEPETGEYHPAYVDAPSLLAAVRAHVQGVPVFDVKQPPEPNLLSLLVDSVPNSWSIAAP